MLQSFLSLASLSCFGLALTQTGPDQLATITCGFVLLSASWLVLGIDACTLLRGKPAVKPMTHAEMIDETMSRR